MRQGFQIQRLLERDARSGTRYKEVLEAHWHGVSPPDFRLQRPEYLGGGSTPIAITPVAQTSESAASEQGNLAAVGTVNALGHGFTYSATEHGFIIGMCNVRADLTYQQGIDRFWNRQTRYDFYMPVLSRLGEQAVLRKELFVNGVSDDEVFGYQERWAELRYKNSKITGKMRSEAEGSLDVWHLSQEFATAPNLNENFIQDEPPIDRVVAVPVEPHFKLDCWFNLKSARMMPMYSVPGLIDHF